METATAEFTARHRYARITARKARFVADMIRGQSVNRALEMLEFAPQRAAAFYLRVLKSAVANASQDEDVNLNHLLITDCRADDGPLLNNRLRWRAGPQGRAMPFAKRTSHLRVSVGELGEIAPVAPTDAGAEPAAESVKTEKKGTKKKASTKKAATKKTAKKKTTREKKEDS